MQVASLENSKRLYELSKWAETDKGYSKYPAPEPLKYHYKLENGCRKRGAVPAYPLGYLLRKLPKRENSLHPGIHITQGTVWWEASLGMKFIAKAKTPEDAACLLAIKLLDEGILSTNNKEEQS